MGGFRHLKASPWHLLIVFACRLVQRRKFMERCKKWRSCGKCILIKLRTHIDWKMLHWKQISDKSKFSNYIIFTINHFFCVIYKAVEMYRQFNTLHSYKLQLGPKRDINPFVSPFVVPNQFAAKWTRTESTIILPKMSGFFARFPGTFVIWINRKTQDAFASPRTNLSLPSFRHSKLFPTAFRQKLSRSGTRQVDGW